VRASPRRFDRKVLGQFNLVLGTAGGVLQSCPTLPFLVYRVMRHGTDFLRKGRRVGPAFELDLQTVEAWVALPCDLPSVVTPEPFQNGKAGPLQLA
jgi:hypothetical protein